jgi:hypothetical protein
MARRERHLLELADIPRADDDAPRIGLVADHVERALDLVDLPAVGCVPGAPLRAVDGAQVAVLVGPFVPDRDLVVAQVLDIRVAFEKPEQLVNDRAQV